MYIPLIRGNDIESVELKAVSFSDGAGSLPTIPKPPNSSADSVPDKLPKSLSIHNTRNPVPQATIPPPTSACHILPSEGT